MRAAYLMPLLLGLCACSATPKPKAVVPHKEPAKAAEVVWPKKEAKAVEVEAPVPIQHLVSLESTPTNPFVLADKPGEIVVRLRVSADKVQNAERPPVNLALVVDTSGSMAGDAIKHARAASVAMLERLAPGDALSVVTFGSTAEALVPATILSKDNRAEIRVKIEEMAAQGTTDMGGGLSVGMAQLQRHFKQNGVNRIVLLGDGVPNDASRVLPLARSAGGRGISITALGLGLEYDETLMSQIAAASHGIFRFIHEPDKVAAVFDHEVLRIKRVVARRAWMTITPGPGVVLNDVLGQSAQRSGRGLRVQLGDLSEGQTRDVMVRVNVSGKRAGANVELINAVLQYQDAVSDQQARKETAFVSLRSTKDEDEHAKARNTAIEHEATRMRVADLIVRAIATARAGDLKGARRFVDTGMKLAREGAKTFEDEELAAKIKEMTKLRASLPSLLPPRPQHFGHFGGRPTMPSSPFMSKPRPAPKPATAYTVRKAHGDATRVLQGL